MFKLWLWIISLSILFSIATVSYLKFSSGIRIVINNHRPIEIRNLEMFYAGTSEKIPFIPSKSSCSFYVYPDNENDLNMDYSYQGQMIYETILCVGQSVGHCDFVEINIIEGYHKLNIYFK